MEKVSFIGYVISDDGIIKDPSEVDAVLQGEAPKLVTETRNFLDFIWMYYCYDFESKVFSNHKNIEYLFGLKE